MHKIDKGNACNKLISKKKTKKEKVNYIQTYQPWTVSVRWNKNKRGNVSHNQCPIPNSQLWLALKRKKSSDDVNLET